MFSFYLPCFALFAFLFHLQNYTAWAATPIALPCPNYTFPDVICMTRYGSLMPQGFNRTVLYTIGFNDYYPQTHVPDDPSFSTVANASFLVWDPARGPEILGPNPSVDSMFTLPLIGHEAPVYEPNLNLFFFSALDPATPSQYVVDLNQNPPTLSNRTANPPILLPTGATYHAGLIYISGSTSTSTNTTTFTPSINTLNASTGNTTPLFNNYYGYRFTTIDDLAFAPNGDIWFTDDFYATALSKTPSLPQLEPAVYRYVPSTGLIQLLTDTLISPNGIAFSPSGSTVYITDTPTDSLTLHPPGSNLSAPSSSYTPTFNYIPWHHRTIYAFDVLNNGTGLANKRAIFLAQDRIPDGIKVARNGYIVTATGHGVDVLDEEGVPLVRVQTNFSVVNVAWAGEGLRDLWLVGIGGVARVRWNLPGRELR